MFALRTLLRPSAGIALRRPYTTTASLRLPYKDDQDRESLKPRSTENTKTGSDQEIAAEDPDAAFNPDKTSPEEATRAANDGAARNPLEGSGANQKLSKPRGDEKSQNDTGPGEEVQKGGKSTGHSAQKKGGPQKVPKSTPPQGGYEY